MSNLNLSPFSLKLLWHVLPLQPLSLSILHVSPFKYRNITIRSPQSILYSKLNNSNSLLQFSFNLHFGVQHRLSSIRIFKGSNWLVHVDGCFSETANNEVSYSEVSFWYLKLNIRKIKTNFTANLFNRWTAHAEVNWPSKEIDSLLHFSLKICQPDRNKQCLILFLEQVPAWSERSVNYEKKKSH